MEPYPVWDLEILKDDLGIPAGDTSQDAWLTRRMNETLDAIRDYTARFLTPITTFIDDWTNVDDVRLAQAYPPGRAGNSIYLSQFPVVSIEACETNGTIDPASVLFDPRTGQLKGTGIGYTPLSFQNSKVTYRAGYDKLPSPIYSVMLGIMTNLYSARRSMQTTGGLSIGGIDSVSLADVGQLKFSSPSYGFDSNMSGYEGMDPILGPYTKVLDGYKDWRNKLGLAGFPQHSILAVPADAAFEPPLLIGGDR